MIDVFTFSGTLSKVLSKVQNQNKTGGWYIPVESSRTVRQFLKVVLQKKQEGKDGLGTDTCRSFAGLRDASQDNQTSTIIFHIGKGPTKGFLPIFLIPWKKGQKATSSSNLYSRLLLEIEREYYKCFLAGKAKFSIPSRLCPDQRSPEWSWEVL